MHSDLDNFKDSFFNVPKNPHQEDIGLYVRYKNPTCGVERIDIFKIVSTQYLFDGRLAYRVEATTDTHHLGRTALFDSVYVVDAPTEEDIKRIEEETNKSFSPELTSEDFEDLDIYDVYEKYMRRKK